MLNQIQSFRQKLLISYLLFVVVMLAVCSEIFWFNYLFASLNSLENDNKKMMMLNLQMYKTEKSFIQKDITNISFYNTGKSDFLVAHSNHLIDNLQLVESFKSSATHVGLYSENELNNLENAFKTYESKFENTIALLRKRGFKDYGVEGSMRKNIHKLEQKYPEFGKIMMLTLRRHEKDYIIRKDMVYAKRLNFVANQAIKKTFTKNRKRQRQIIALVKAYKSDFNKLVSLDTKVAASFEDKDKYFLNNIEKIIEKLIEKSTIYIRDQSEFLNTLFFTIVIVSIIFAIFLSYFFSKFITKPIAQLTENVEQVIQSNFATAIDRTNIHTRDEIGLLTSKFHFMIEKIRSYIGEIEHSNSQLENQNNKLQSLNQELVSTNSVLQRKEDHIQKMNTIKDKFFAILSHDLRGPLTTTKGFLSILADHPDSMPEELKKETINKLKKSIDLQLELLSNLLDWSSAKVDEIKFSPEQISIGVMVDKNFELIAERANTKNIMLVNDLEDNCEVVADKNMIDFILRNLISNAVKFTTDNGKIVVSAHRSKDEVEIAIADSGVGISDKQFKFILKPGVHFTTSGTANEKGTGFGLLVCKEFVEKHGGKLKIKSKEGEGTVVSFTIKNQTDINNFIKTNKNNTAIALEYTKVIDIV
ncbi:MAG: ATP-binding protein [Cytophagales bacterium]